MNQLTARLLLLIALLGSAARLGAQTVVFDSSGYDFNYYAPLSQYYAAQAQHFTTDNGSDLTLTGMSLRIDYTVGTANPLITIRADTGGDPDVGTSLGSMTSMAGPITSSGIYDFAGNVTLSANTGYWVLVDWNGTAPDEFGITTVDPRSGTGAGTWLTGDDQVLYSNSSGWYSDSNSMLYMTLSVSSTAIPEPSTYAALLGLGAMGVVAWKRRPRVA